jgi:excisionase family DNA binding protein
MRTTVKWNGRLGGGQSSLKKGTAMAKSPPDTVMTIEELSKYLKISKSTLYKLAQQSKLPGQKIGKRWRFHKQAIDRLLQNAPTRRR